MGNLLRHGVHDGLRGHDGACNCSFGVDGLAGRIRIATLKCQKTPATLCVVAPSLTPDSYTPAPTSMLVL